MVLRLRRRRGAHIALRTPVSGRKWRRRVLGLPVTGWLIGIAGTALAVAGFMVLLNVTGTVSADDGIDVAYLTVSPGNEGTGATCGGSVVSPDTVNITMGSLSGQSEVCKYILEIENTGAEDARLQAFQLTSADFVGGEIVPSVEVCGATIPAGTVGTVAVFLEAGAVTPGQTFDFVPGEDGLLWTIASQYVPASCVQF
jgi:hypothetical protein